MKTVINTIDKYHIEETIKIMRTLEIISLKSNRLKSLVRYVFKPYRDNLPLLFQNIWKFIKENFNYVTQEYTDLITAPYILLNTKEGDCKDFSLFTKTVLNILGVKSNYILLGKAGNDFSHIAVISNGVIIDGANERFNSIPEIYINRKII